MTDAVAVLSRYDNLTGGYKRRQDKDGEVVYSNEEDEKDLWYDSHKKTWIISDKNKANTYATSKPTRVATSPETAIFPGISVRPIKKKNIDWNADDNKFHDNEFPTSTSSLGLKYKNDEIIWVRAAKLSTKDDGTPAPLFNKIEPNDIAQGALGDCWCLCAISALAEFPNYIKESLFETKQVSNDGKYTLKLFHPNKKWMRVTIDDFIACKKCEWWEDRPRPIFAQPHGNESWVLLLERAFAKIAQGYDKLDGGYPLLAWMCMTGCEDLSIWQRQSNNLWTESIATIDKNNFTFSKLSALPGPSPPATDQALFNHLSAYDSKNYLLGASIGGTVVEKKRTDGLVERHAYTLLRVVTYQDIQLVQLRNPWGNSIEWNGAWSDSSEEWDMYPSAYMELQYERNKNDGMFWMPFSAFATTFDMIQVCKCSMSKHIHQTKSSSATIVSPCATSLSFPRVLSSNQRRPSSLEEELRCQIATVTAERDAVKSHLKCLEGRVSELERRLFSSVISSERPSSSRDPRHDRILYQARRVYDDIMQGSNTYYSDGNYSSERRPRTSLS
uniref:Calpain catalytic domain-containing protein n=1 Tax=Aureoumbra lagunensis TaxID=44058 RepID=A0A7S3K6D0_9STRA|mmetsp:Transcript_18966/g.28627  ORF Transcript_18966/g.28627 Transcript_18966/m.28627 type:complete len:558 (+) Transcript_18966:93-1766(+)